MQLTHDPAAEKGSIDVANYRRDFGNNPVAKDEIKKHLRNRNGTKYPPNTPDLVFRRLEAYQDFAFGGTQPEHRLGGSLDQTTAAPPPAHQRDEEEFIDFPVGHDSDKTGRVHVLANGTIVHADVTGDDGEATHNYMHHVFNYVLYKTRDLTETINRALNWYNEAMVQGPKSQDAQDAAIAYNDAVEEFEKFRNNGEGNIFFDAFTDTNVSGVVKKAIDITPVKTNEGYYVSARITVNWKNPYHSSSTIRVP